METINDTLIDTSKPISLDNIDINKLGKLINSLDNYCREHPEVYLIKCDKYHKIGVSFDAWQRIKVLQQHIPHDLELIYHNEVKDAYKLEAQLHRKFKSKRKRGEWFELDKKDINIVINIITNDSF